MHRPLTDQDVNWLGADVTMFGVSGGETGGCADVEGRRDWRGLFTSSGEVFALNRSERCTLNVELTHGNGTHLWKNLSDRGDLFVCAEFERESEGYGRHAIPQSSKNRNSIIE
jgi:hypothetical protein